MIGPDQRYSQMWKAAETVLAVAQGEDVAEGGRVVEQCARSRKNSK